MKKLMLGVMAVMMGVVMLGGPVWADTSTASSDSGGGGSKRNCDRMFLLLKPWYSGLTDADCNIKKVNESEAGPAEGEVTLNVLVWTIVTNILYDLFVVVGYVATGFIVYGGYLYLLARGESSMIEKGKKTLVGAISGLVIAILAAMIVSFISNAILNIGVS